MQAPGRPLISITTSRIKNLPTVSWHRNPQSKTPLDGIELNRRRLLPRAMPPAYNRGVFFAGSGTGSLIAQSDERAGIANG